MADGETLHDQNKIAGLCGDKTLAAVCGKCCFYVMLRTDV